MKSKMDSAIQHTNLIEDKDLKMNSLEKEKARQEIRRLIAPMTTEQLEEQFIRTFINFDEMKKEITKRHQRDAEKFAKEVMGD